MDCQVGAYALVNRWSGRLANYSGDTLDNLVFYVPSPEHFRNIDCEEQCGQQEGFYGGYREVLNEFPNSNMDCEIIRLTRDTYRERAVGCDYVPQYPCLLSLNDLSQRCSGCLNLVSLILQILNDLLRELAQILVLALKSDYFF